MEHYLIGYGKNRQLFEQILSEINDCLDILSRKQFSVINCLQDVCQKTENNINFLIFVASMCLYVGNADQETLSQFFRDTFHDDELDAFCEQLFGCIRQFRTYLFNSEKDIQNIFTAHKSELIDLFRKIYLLHESDFSKKYEIEITAYYMNWLYYASATVFYLVCFPEADTVTQDQITDVLLSFVNRLSGCLMYPCDFYGKPYIIETYYLNHEKQKVSVSPFVNVSPGDWLEPVLPVAKTAAEPALLMQISLQMHEARVKAEMEKEKAEKAVQDKKQVISEFAHTYGNMRTTTLHDIGTELLEVGDPVLHDWGRKIMVEFAIKQNLTKEVEMLRLQFEDNTSDLVAKLRETIISSDGLTVSDLVSDALQRCFMALLYGETRSDKSRRKLFFGTDDYAKQREALQDSFDESVLINGMNMLSWLEQNQALKMSVSVSGAWETLQFDNGGYAALLLTNWIAELLTNAMKYADKSGMIRLSFDQQDTVLCIGISNNIDQATKNIHGEQHGISSISASVARLNQAVGVKENPTVLQSADKDYQLKLCIASTVFLG